MFDLEDEQKNYVIIGLLLIVLVLIGGAFYFYEDQNCPEPDGAISEVDKIVPEKAQAKVAQFINQNFTQGDQEATVENISSTSSLYKLSLKIGERNFSSYMTKDGTFLFPEGYNLNQERSQNDQQNQNKSVPKRDEVDFKLFTMSYCPFGLQSMKAYLPVYELMKDETDMGIYFVDYAMHDKKELDENMRQYCIQKNQTDKFPDYLSCFVESGEAEKCAEKAGVDQNSLSSCVSSVDEEYKVTEKYNDESTWVNGDYPKFNLHSELNEKYGVSGSPTIVINGQKTRPDSRSPEGLKKAICEGFNEKPEECSQTLSTSTPSSGFGGGTASNSSGGGSCE